jgi:hypothetical protein
MLPQRYVYVDSHGGQRIRSNKDNIIPRIWEIKVLNNTVLVHNKLTSLFGSSELQTQCFH